MSKVVKIEEERVWFDDGRKIESEHNQSCCEWHNLLFTDADVVDLMGAELDLMGQFFERVPNYGIRLLPVGALPIAVPGYAKNNGYYTTNLSLVVFDAGGKEVARHDITECQADEG